MIVDEYKFGNNTLSGYLALPLTAGEEVFLSSGTFTVPLRAGYVEVLVVAGGGGSGGTSNSYGFGGDAGQVIHQTDAVVTPGSEVNVVVGGAGAAGGGYNGVSSTSGGNSSFGSITATGGKGSCATMYPPYAVSGGQGGDGLNCNGVKANGLNVKVNGDTVFGVIFGSSYGWAACDTSPPARSPNTGDGGHGVWSSSNRAGSNGGSGIVIVRWGGYSEDYE